MEVVHHEEAALEQVLAQAGGLLIAEGPALDLDGVDEGKVEDVVAVEIDDLLVASRVDAREAPERREKRDVGFGVILDQLPPRRRPNPERAAERRVLQPRPGKLVLGVGVPVRAL